MWTFCGTAGCSTVIAAHPAHHTGKLCDVGRGCRREFGLQRRQRKLGQKVRINKKLFFYSKEFFGWLINKEFSMFVVLLILARTAPSWLQGVFQKRRMKHSRRNPIGLWRVPSKNNSRKSPTNYYYPRKLYFSTDWRNDAGYFLKYAPLFFFIKRTCKKYLQNNLQILLTYFQPIKFAVTKRFCFRAL